MSKVLGPIACFCGDFVRTGVWELAGNQPLGSSNTPRFIQKSHWPFPDEGQWVLLEGKKRRVLGSEVPIEFHKIEQSGTYEAAFVEARIKFGDRYKVYCSKEERARDAEFYAEFQEEVNRIRAEIDSRLPRSKYTDEKFWKRIDEARKPRRGQPERSATGERMEKVFENRSVQDAGGFGQYFSRKLEELNTWELWGAGYVIAGGMSDDAFRYFRDWIIGKGEAVFNVALHSPDDLGDFIAQGEEVQNEDLENAIDLGPDEEGETRGHPFDEETVWSKYPKLTARFGPRSGA